MEKKGRKSTRGKKRSINESLISSIERGDLESARDFISTNGLKFIETWQGGYQLLCTVIQDNHTDIALLFINNGFICQPIKDNYYYSTCNCNTLLHYAVKNNNLKVADLLLKKSLDVNAFNGDGETPLHIAIENKNYEITKLIIKSKANLTIEYKTTKYGNNYSIVFITLFHKKKEIINLLKDEINNEILKKKKTWHSKNEIHNLEIMLKLLQLRKDIHFKYFPHSGDKYSLLYLAVHKNDEQLVEMVLNDTGIKCPYINTEDDEDKTLLEVAFENNNLKIMEHLINKGAHINDIYYNESGEEFTFLYKALENNNQQICQLLMKKHFPNVYQDENNLTTLHLAIKKGFVDVVEKILYYLSSSDIYQSNYELLQSTSKFAQKINNQQIIKLFKMFKIKQMNYLCNSDNISTIILNYSDQHILEFLHKLWANKQTNLNQLFINAIEQKRDNIVNESINFGADVDTRSKTGNFAIHIAISLNNKHLLNLLLENGADVNNKNSQGQTALTLAIELHQIKTIEILLDFGADIYVRNGKGYRSIDIMLNDGIYSHNFHCYPSLLKIKHIFLKYILKKHYANLYVDEKCLKHLQNDSQCEINAEKMLNEIEIMKRQRINDTNVTFYNFLKYFNNIHRLARYIENPDIEQVLESIQWNSFLPIYGNILKSLFIKARQRKLLLHQFRYYLDLPDICVDEITSYLSTYEMKVFIQANKFS